MSIHGKNIKFCLSSRVKSLHVVLKQTVRLTQWRQHSARLFPGQNESECFIVDINDFPSLRETFGLMYV